MFTGILPICQDEEGLAAVLSHGKFHYHLSRSGILTSLSEIGHVVARYTAERLSGQTVQWIMLGLFSFVLGVDFGITNAFNTLFLELPNSRTQEREGTPHTVRSPVRLH